MTQRTGNKSRGLPIFVTDYLGMALALVVLLLIFGLCAGNFFTLTNFRTIANQVSDTTIVAVGMTFVLIIAGVFAAIALVLLFGERSTKSPDTR